MLRIRLSRVGRRNQPSYRVVIIERTKAAKANYLESFGLYNPRQNVFTVNEDRVLHWLNVGAQPTERLAKLLTTAGVKHKLINLPDYDRKPKRPPKKVTAQGPATPVQAGSEQTKVEPQEVITETSEAEVAGETETTETTKEIQEATASESGSNSQPDEVVPNETEN